MRIIICLLVGALGVWAQPKVTGIAHSADFSTVLAPGTLGSIFGTGFATTQASATTLPLPAVLNGVSVKVNGTTAPLTFVNGTQINFQVPYGTPAGTASLTVTSSGQTSAAAPFSVAAYAPGVFQYGVNRGVIQNHDYSLNSATNAAAPGSYVIVYLAGIGITSPPVADGAAAPSSPLARPLTTGTATIGGVSAPVAFLGLTPGSAGLAQANIQVPSLSADGDYPLVLQLGGAVSKPVIISAKGTPAGGTGLPAGANCISGSVNSITFSLQYKTPGLADEVVIAGTKLCATCAVKPPVYPEFVEKLEDIRVAGINADACYDGAGSVNLVRMRP
jgi:uncharacterized protein (TIGR03437 family)